MERQRERKEMERERERKTDPSWPPSASAVGQDDLTASAETGETSFLTSELRLHALTSGTGSCWPGGPQLSPPHHHNISELTLEPRHALSENLLHAQ